MDREWFVDSECVCMSLPDTGNKLGSAGATALAPYLKLVGNLASLDLSSPLSLGVYLLF